MIAIRPIPGSKFDPLQSAAKGQETEANIAGRQKD
jgi:hypothetical protein